MSIGEALLAARNRAGLTVSEVSSSTRIREVIVRGIERDDFSACGGDFYARGHIRAIAGAVGTDPRPLIEEYDSTRRIQEIAAAAVFAPATPIKLRERRGPNWTAVLSVLVLAALGFAGYLFFTGSGHSADAGLHGRPHSGHGSPSAAGKAHRGSDTAVHARLVTPVSAAAFGPSGLGSGDDPADAPLAIDGIAGTAWHTSWYGSANFGFVQSGTGLLIDLGKPMAITAVRLTLGQPRGARLELRVGDSPTPASLRAVARESGAGGVVRLRLAVPVVGRYALIWFTRLPLDPTGSYFASVYGIKIYGAQPGALKGQLDS
ncbi:MAG TPA: helix-turn-helix domain-containing protein [Streptosporangiaceae bacterium]|nr:helix-turn-helix domain-containing protein [Streptosporangiaceae bacterium]